MIHEIRRNLEVNPVMNFLQESDIPFEKMWFGQDTPKI
jgi:hypothetical protein